MSMFWKTSSNKTPQSRGAPDRRAVDQQDSGYRHQGSVPRPPAAPVQRAPRSSASAPVHQAAPSTVVDKLVDLPTHTRLLSGVHGPLASIVRAEERDNVVVVDDPGAPDASSGAPPGCQVFCVDTYLRSNIGFSDLRQRLKRAGFEIHLPPVRVTPELVRALYGQEVATKDEGSEPSRMRDLFRTIAQQAIDRQATDIHIEIRKSRAQIRFRVFKQLVDIQDLDGADAVKMVRALYQSAADSDSRGDEVFNTKARHQCAIQDSFRGAAYRFRFQSIPITPEGLDVVLRILPVGVNEKGRYKTFQELGYSGEQSAMLKEMFLRPKGTIIFAGVVNSGKSTTLKHGISMVIDVKPGIKVRTVEDPVEYMIPGASQTNVQRSDADDRETDGRTSEFALTMKACMRGDSNFIMCGEVRDPPSAELLVQAVQSGQQVATTNHAESAFGIIPRLVDLGIEQTVLAAPNFISGMIYQELLPTVCPHCSILGSDFVPETTADVELYQRIVGSFSAYLHNIRFRGPGCSSCKNLKVLGMTVCAEVVALTNDIRKLLRDGLYIEAEAEWRALAKSDKSEADGMTVLTHSIFKMISGIVSPSDVETTLGPLTRRFLLDRMSQAHQSLISASEVPVANARAYAQTVRNSRGAAQ